MVKSTIFWSDLDRWVVLTVFIECGDNETHPKYAIYKSFFFLYLFLHKKVICLPVSPRCDACDLNTKALCPSAQKVSNAQNRKTIVFSKPEDYAYPKLEIKLEKDKQQEEIGEEVNLEEVMVKTED